MSGTDSETGAGGNVGAGDTCGPRQWAAESRSPAASVSGEIALVESPVGGLLALSMSSLAGLRPGKIGAGHKMEVRRSEAYTVDGPSTQVDAIAVSIDVSANGLPSLIHP
jgi:hypothetical protein